MVAFSKISPALFTGTVNGEMAIWDLNTHVARFNFSSTVTNHSFLIQFLEVGALEKLPLDFSTEPKTTFSEGHTWQENGLSGQNEKQFNFGSVQNDFSNTGVFFCRKAS